MIHQPILFPSNKDISTVNMPNLERRLQVARATVMQMMATLLKRQAIQHFLHTKGDKGDTCVCISMCIYVYMCVCILTGIQTALISLYKTRENIKEEKRGMLSL